MDDHVFYEESNLESDEETLEVDGKSDPILVQAEGDLTKSPRAYAVAALKIALDKIVEHHGNVQDWFKASFDLHVSLYFRVSTGQVHRGGCRRGRTHCGCWLTDIAGLDRLPTQMTAL